MEPQVRHHQFDFYISYTVYLGLRNGSKYAIFNKQQMESVSVRSDVCVLGGTGNGSSKTVLDT